MSRPLVLADTPAGTHVVFRDAERGGGIAIASTADPDREHWTSRELFTPDVGMWEPVHDPVAWSRDGERHLLVQRIGQGDAETLEQIPPQTVKVLEWRVDGPAMTAAAVVEARGLTKRGSRPATCDVRRATCDAQPSFR